jgi:hypothetical protein
MRRDATGANIALSFIDVLASALGAAVLLFVLLASTPMSVPSHAQAAGSFIRYQWTVLGDPNALLRISIKSPLDSTTNIIDLKNFSGQAVRKCGLLGVSSYLLIGFASDADETRGELPHNRTYVLRLNQPVSGAWRVGVFYYDRTGDLSSAPVNIKVTTTVSKDTSADFKPSDLAKTDVFGKGPLPVGDGAITLKFGEQLLAPTVTEKGKGTNTSGCG